MTRAAFPISLKRTPVRRHRVAIGMNEDFPECLLMTRKSNPVRKRAIIDNATGSSFTLIV